MFIIEVIVGGGVVLDYIYIEVFPPNEGGRILETPLKSMQSTTNNYLSAKKTT